MVLATNTIDPGAVKDISQRMDADRDGYLSTEEQSVFIQTDENAYNTWINGIGEAQISQITPEATEPQTIYNEKSAQGIHNKPLDNNSMTSISDALFGRGTIYQKAMDFLTNPIGAGAAVAGGIALSTATAGILGGLLSTTVSPLTGGVVAFGALTIAGGLLQDIKIGDKTINRRIDNLWNGITDIPLIGRAFSWAGGQVSSTVRLVPNAVTGAFSAIELTARDTLNWFADAFDWVGGLFS